MCSPSDKTGMDVTDLFLHLKLEGEKAGVKVFIIDCEPDTARRGISIGIEDAQRRFLHQPGPALVLGLEDKTNLLRFKTFLDLPFVRYLELPFTQDEFQRQAKSVCGIKVDTTALEGVRQAVTDYALESIRRNVTHRLNGVTLILIRDAAKVCRGLAEATDSQGKAKRNLAEKVTVLASSDKNVRATLEILDREICALDGVCSARVFKVLNTQRILLWKAAVDLTRFVKGVAAWTRSEMAPESLYQLAELGVEVSRVFMETGSAFTKLSEGKKEM